MKYLLLLGILCITGCDDNSSSIDATMTTDDKYVYFLKDFCSEENVKITISQIGREENHILEFRGGGMVFTPCPGAKIKKAYRNLTPEDVERHKKEYRERYQPKK